MNKNFRNAKLNDLYKFQYGKGNTIEDIGGDYPIYGSNGPVGYTNIYNSENAPVIGHIGAYAGIVNWASGKHYVTYNGVICRIKKGINNRFGYYTLLVSNLQNRLRGSTQPFVSYDLLNDVKVYLPDRGIQDNIAKILSDLDYKIEVNIKINQELETMAKTLYDYWFVQFDFPAYLSGSLSGAEGYKSSGGKMVFNEKLKREIPEGWEAGTFETISKIIGGSTPSKAVSENFTVEKYISWITPKDLSMNKGNKFITRGEWDVTDVGVKSASLKIMPKNTVLLSSRAPIGYLAISREEVTTNQGFKSFVPKKNYSTEFVFYCVKNEIPKIEAYSSGSTFKEVSASTLKTIYICIPEEDILEEYNKISKPIFRKQNLIELENQKLSELRDWLLPMLMNGQVRVGDEYGEDEGELGMVAEENKKYN